MPDGPRLRTPRGHREVVTDPAFAELPNSVEQNRSRLNQSATLIDGIPLSELRGLARREILGRDLSSPLIVAGHQPELYHPGVWVKNFAASGLATRLHGTAINLIVDNDEVKSTDLRLPTWDRWEPSRVRVVNIPIQPPTATTTWEATRITDEALFRSLPDRVAAFTTNWPEEPILRRLWPTLPGGTLAERFTHARRLMEQEWGCDIRDYPVSELSNTQAFGYFVRHLLEHRDRFRECHNAAVREYRRRHKLRSVTHPVPELTVGELPFWSSTSTGQRRKAFGHSPDGVRPRAITLTLFSRLILGDFFIHGLGGGKYDEVTDGIIRTFFGLEPPTFQILSGTLHLPLPYFPATSEQAEELRTKLRSLDWNPHAHIRGAASEEHWRLRELRPIDRRGRREQYRGFRELVMNLRPQVTEERTKTEENLQRCEAEVTANRILRDRDYSWVLHPAEPLRTFLQGVAEQISR